MTTKPDLGPTWETAIKSAYSYGYEAFVYSSAGIIQEAREIAEVEGDSMAVHWLNNNADWFISECDEHRLLWQAIEEFYEEHMSEEAYERLQREAVVAEDIDVAFEAGAIDAILGNEYDPSKVNFLC